MLRDRVDLNSDASSLFNGGPKINSLWADSSPEQHQLDYDERVFPRIVHFAQQ